jgi:DNA (cytosine-5)-methyltransferase 1
MRYLSVCSGIEAASVAWAPMGWDPVAFAEIEPFPSAVLAHHYPDVPNLGDITKFKEWPDLGTVDLICGGTPCQSFSVAGLRKGLADPRGNLSLTFLAIVDRYRPRYVIWENVPGVLSSDGGRDFASFLGGLGQLGYGWCYRVLDAQFCRVDGFPRAVPQRRRRVFVVGYLGDWRRAAAILSEPESVLGDSPPRREARQGPADPTALSVAIRGRDGTPQAELGEDIANAILTPNGGRAGVGVGAVLAFGGNNCSGPIDAAASLAAHGGPMGRMDFASETFVAAPLGAKKDGGWRGDLDNDTYVPIAFNSREDPETTWDRTGPLGSSSPQAQAIAYSIMPQNSGKDYKARQVDVAQPIMAGGPVGGNQGGDYLLQPVNEVRPINTMVGLRHEALGEGTGLGIGKVGDPAFTLSKAHSHAVQHGWAVRRLMPVECCRLQGFPDDYLSQVTWRGKCPPPDGPMYKALGNSWAVNVARWVGRRVEMVEQIAAEIEREAAA